MSRLRAGILGQPSVTIDELEARRLSVVQPDTAGDLRAGELDQLDPQADILLLLAGGAPRHRVRFSGSESLLGPVRIGDDAAPTPGFSLDVPGPVNLGGGIAVPNLSRSMTNAGGDLLRAGELTQIVGGGADRVQRTLATSFTTVDLFGAASADIAAGAAGLVGYAGVVLAQLETGLTVAAGDRVYLSASVPGAGTTVAPTAAGTLVAEVGSVLNASAYVGTMVSNSLATVFLARKPPVTV